MKRIFALIFSCLLTVPAMAQVANGQVMNAASLFNGAFMYAIPASYEPSNLMLGTVLNYTPEALLDQSPKVWCSHEKGKFPYTFQVEFTETYVLQELVFNNICENFEGIGAKDVDVEIAAAPGLASFNWLGSYSLNENQVSRIAIAPVEARAIRITIRSNHGNNKFTELAEFEANGYRKLKGINTINVDGTWNSNWGDVYFQQNNSLLSGHYVFNEGVIQYGGIDRNLIQFKWVEKKINNEGQTIMFLNQEGNRLTGVWCHGTNWEDYGFWILNRKNGIPLAVQTQSDPVAATVVDKAIVTELKNELDRSKKLVLYGINFETNSAVLLPSSISTLQHVSELLANNPTIKIRIEGHTDDLGAEGYNDKISLDRAKSVQTYLTGVMSVDPKRLVYEGKGERFPLTSNLTETGKSVNRRVELHQIDGQ